MKKTLETSPPTYARQLGDYNVSFDLTSAQPEVVNHGRYLLFDLLGAALSGIDTIMLVFLASRRHEFHCLYS